MFSAEYLRFFRYNLCKSLHAECTFVHYLQQSGTDEDHKIVGGPRSRNVRDGAGRSRIGQKAVHDSQGDRIDCYSKAAFICKKVVLLENCSRGLTSQEISHPIWGRTEPLVSSSIVSCTVLVQRQCKVHNSKVLKSCPPPLH